MKHILSDQKKKKRKRKKEYTFLSNILDKINKYID